MSEGFGYKLPSGAWAFEGFSFTVAGIGGQLTITPDSIAWPRLGNDPNNQVGLKIHFVGGGFAGEVLFGGPLSMLHVFLDDLERILLGTTEAVEFPSERAVEFLQRQFACRLVYDRSTGTDWLMQCQLATPFVWSSSSPSSLSSDDRKRLAAMLNISLPVEVGSIETCRCGIRDFLRWIETTAADASI